MYVLATNGYRTKKKLIQNCHSRKFWNVYLNWRDTAVSHKYILAYNVPEPISPVFLNFSCISFFQE